MKVAEILKRVADIVELAAGEEPAATAATAAQPDPALQNPARLSPTAAGQPVAEPDAAAATPGEDEVMVPPLQLKLELMKKAVGVDNIYDEERSDQDQQQDQQQDHALDQLRRHAGIRSVPAKVTLVMADDDEFLE